MAPEIILDPRDETEVARIEPAARLGSLAGKTVGLLDISKPKGSAFLDRIESHLRERYDVAEVLRFTKPTFTKPAPLDLRAEIASKCDAVIEALAD